MFILSVKRGVLFALQSFWRNIWLSIATVFVIFLAVMSVDFLLVTGVIANQAVAAVKDKIDVSVYFKPATGESKIAEVKSRLEGNALVKSVAYKSAEQNLESFKSRHLKDAKIQETLNNLSGNPMGAVLVVKANDLKDYPQILRILDDEAYAPLIEEKNYDDNQLVISRINGIAENVRRIVMLISALFVIIAVLIVFNTVRIAIFTHQTEIAVMKLVGAGNWFIRFPFIFESVFSGLIGVVAATIFLYPLLSFIQSYLGSFFGPAAFDLVGYFNGNFIWIIGSELLAIIVLNVVSSLVAVSKYLNV